MEAPKTTRTQVLLQGVSLEVLHIEGQHPSLAPLVFVHEGRGCVDLWGARGRYWPAELCASTGRAGWVYSRQGYGRSDPMTDVRGSNRYQPDYMHREALQRLPYLLAHWGLQRPVLIGHSDGATIALLHAAAHELTACVAIESIEQARQAYESQGLRELLELAACGHSPHRDQPAALTKALTRWLKSLP